MRSKRKRPAVNVIQEEKWFRKDTAEMHLKELMMQFRGIDIDGLRKAMAEKNPEKRVRIIRDAVPDRRLTLDDIEHILIRLDMIKQMQRNIKNAS